MSAWDVMHLQAEDKIDEVFGEPVRFMPYKVAQGYTTGATPDGSRSVVDGVGYVLNKHAALSKDGDVNTKRLESDYLLKAQIKYLTNIRANDRVALLDAKRQGALCEIAYIEPAVNDRAVIHLLMIQDPT
jgi:hypothetical protein